MCRVFLVDKFLSFSVLNNISCHSLLARKVSAEISFLSLMGVPLYIKSCLSLSTFKISCL